ncbi:mitochondrial ATP-dependent protease HslVU peptidase subunit [Andalucia godoyi]|uniref:Mitochondrial ATP-dependent protease HslVU peptidase subunit n=1 Tax=Andalucia godoyi TaxID=505711 RepID=A0A8K0AGJ2_ANDGO|nr:mitochondrial ATP-dependent protease HslVU peptidase subunit [Andalucia godoyi]|eukprot:ANDGO_06435.mRNA.1 mitochondrial ATP-dependent protease HslVU peptidase subunit
MMVQRMVGGSLRITSFRCFSSVSEIHGTTVLCVRRGRDLVMAADGQVTMGSVVLKPNARKIRTMGERGEVLVGFAGSTADAMTLYERLEEKLNEHPGQLQRSCVELAKLWRTDKFLRKLEALMIVADKQVTLTITGNGDVFEPVDGVMAIGSGGSFALAAARAMVDVAPPSMTAEDIARKAISIAADMCIYTNHEITLKKIESALGDVSSTSPTPGQPLQPGRSDSL